MHFKWRIVLSKYYLVRSLSLKPRKTLPKYCKVPFARLKLELSLVRVLKTWTDPQQPSVKCDVVPSLHFKWRIALSKYYLVRSLSLKHRVTLPKYSKVPFARLKLDLSLVRVLKTWTDPQQRLVKCDVVPSLHFKWRIVLCKYYLVRSLSLKPRITLPISITGFRLRS